MTLYKVIVYGYHSGHETFYGTKEKVVAIRADAINKGYGVSGIASV